MASLLINNHSSYSVDYLSSTGKQLFEIEIITLALIYPVILGALQYIGPAFLTAREDIKQLYPMLNITQTIIYGQGDSAYEDWQESFENVLAFYYYKNPDRAANKFNITAFIMGGINTALPICFSNHTLKSKQKLSFPNSFGRVKIFSGMFLFCFNRKWWRYWHCAICSRAR